VAVVLGLVFFHSALVFDSRDDYYVKNGETTDATTILAGLGVVWAMPMLFLIAGLGSWYSLRRRRAPGLARERVLRLGVPLLFATLTIIPIPQYLRLKSADPGYDESYPEFLPRFFDVEFEPSDFPFVLDGEYFETGHLWFVVLLLLFSLILALVAGRAPRGRAGQVREWLAVRARHRGAVLLPAIPVAVISALLGLEEGFAAWSRWAYLLFFLYGFVLASDERFRVAMRSDAVVAATAGVAMFAVGMPVFVLIGESGGDPFTDLSVPAIGARTLYGVSGWLWLVGILGLLDRRRHAEAGAASPTRSYGGRLYGYLAVAALPLYILHQPIVVSVAYGVVGWEAPIVVKYAAIVTASLVLTVAAYDLLVRRTRVTRFLFGLRT
jgi:hypothetical protein